MKCLWCLERVKQGIEFCLVGNFAAFGSVMGRNGTEQEAAMLIDWLALFNFCYSKNAKVMTQWAMWRCNLEMPWRIMVPSNIVWSEYYVQIYVIIDFLWRERYSRPKYCNWREEKNKTSHIACGCWWADELNKWWDLMFRWAVAIIGQMQLSKDELFIGEAVP